MSKILEDWLREGDEREIIIRFDKDKDEFCVTMYQFEFCKSIHNVFRKASAFTIETAMRMVQYKGAEVKQNETE